MHLTDVVSVLRRLPWRCLATSVYDACIVTMAYTRRVPYFTATVVPIRQHVQYSSVSLILMNQMGMLRFGVYTFDVSCTGLLQSGVCLTMSLESTS